MTDTAWHIPDPQVQPEFYASIPAKRLLAWMVDFVLILLVSIAFLPFTAFTGIFFLPAMMLTLGFFYRVFSIAKWSATPGMLLMSIEFRTLAGRRFDAPMAVMHTAMYTGSVMVPVFQFLSCVLMIVTPRAQGLSDMLLGTVALNRRALR